jgi:signal transduction histidine kinase
MIVNAIDDITTNKESSRIKRNVIRVIYPHQSLDISIEADKGRINQVIHNLLDNSLNLPTLVR